MSDVSTQVEDPSWLGPLFDEPLPGEGESATLRGTQFVRRDGILRAGSTLSATQGQTGESFGFKWKKRDTFDSEASLRRMREWLIERYGDVAKAQWWSDYGDAPLVVDAGCGAGMSGAELFADCLQRIRYLGVDVSEAVDVAAARFRERGFSGGFLQADITDLPLADGSVDAIFSEGVLHHTDSTERALKALARKLRPGGRFLFYVYKKKGPIREFTDDYIRDVLGEMQPQAAWDALMPLSELGRALGEMDVQVDVPKDIEILGIPAGPISLQRLFYWHVFKAFHHPELTLEEMHHINFDWYAPANAHRQTPEEVRSWCAEAGLEIERESIQPAGITIVARRTSQS